MSRSSTFPVNAMRKVSLVLSALVISATAAQARPATNADINRYIHDIKPTLALAFDTCLWSYSAQQDQTACLGQYVTPWNKAWFAKHDIQFSRQRDADRLQRLVLIGKAIEAKAQAKINAERKRDIAANGAQTDYGPAPFKYVVAKHPISSRDLDLMARDIKAQQPKMHAVCDTKADRDGCMTMLNAWYGNHWRQKHPEIDFTAMAH